MKSGDAHDRLRVALKSELQRNFGRIQEIERELSRSEGYLSKFCRGDISIPVDVLLDSLELLDTHPGRFFSRALGSSTNSYSALRDLADEAPDKSLTRILKSLDNQVARTVASPWTGPPEHFESPRFDPTDKDRRLAEGILDCSGLEQRRRLKNAKRYRTSGFADLYIQSLIQLCYNSPRVAVKQAETVITDFLPELVDAHPIDKVNLILRCLAAWAFANRMIGQIPQAALALQVGIRISTRLELSATEGQLIRVGAYLLNDECAYADALQLLSQAMILFDELDQDIEVGKVQIQRGIIFNELGRDRSAEKAFHRALARLQSSDTSLARYRSAAFHGLARAARNSGNLDQAKLWHDRYLSSLDTSMGLFVRGKALWEKGSLHYDKGELATAEQAFLESRDLLYACESPQAVMVCLDLTRVWLDQHRFEEAVELAEGMARLLNSFRKNKLNEAALLEYIRAAHEGRLSLALVEKMRRKMESQSSSV